MAKVIAVLGATGAQGGGLVEPVGNPLDGGQGIDAVLRVGVAPRLELGERGAVTTVPGGGHGEREHRDDNVTGGQVGASVAQSLLLGSDPANSL